MSAIESKGQVGERSVADGSENIIRTERTAGIVTAPGRGRFAEPASRGRVFCASNVAAGVAPGTALSTTPPFLLWNPANSPVNLEVLRARSAYVSGTLGLGVIVYAFNPSQPAQPTGGTALAVQSTKVNGSSGTGKAFTGATLTVAPTLLLPMGTMTPQVVGTVIRSNDIIEDDIDGEIVVPPGAALAIQAIGAAGTTPLLIFSLTWQEVPV